MNSERPKNVMQESGCVSFEDTEGLVVEAVEYIDSQSCKKTFCYATETTKGRGAGTFPIKCLKVHHLVRFFQA